MSRPAVIFDFDGTLLNTLDDLADCMNGVLAEHNLPVHPVDPYRYFVGRGMRNLAESAAPAGTPAEVVASLVSGMSERYRDRWMIKTRPYDGVPEMLAELRRRGVRMAILSNKPDAFTKVMATHFFGDGVFASVRGATDECPIKPDPAGALWIAREFGLEPREFLYLGDTDTDMRTGLAAGMHTVGVAWGFRPEKELRESGAMAILHHPGEVMELV